MKKISGLLSICLIVLFVVSCNNTSITNTPETETLVSEEGSRADVSNISEATEIPTVIAEATTLVLPEGEVVVSSLGEFQNAIDDQENKIIHINSTIEINQEVTFERDDDLQIIIGSDVTLVINQSVTIVSCSIVNDGIIIVNNNFERGISDLTNDGEIKVNAGGIVISGMSNTENHGTFTIELDGELFVERGSIFNNFAELTNNGHISVSDGGQLNDEGGSITNNGTIDLSAYFNGDITNISGTGILNDNRE